MIIRGDPVPVPGGWRYTVEYPNALVRRDANFQQVYESRFDTVFVPASEVYAASGDGDAIAAAVLAAAEIDPVGSVRDIDLREWRAQKAKGVDRPIASAKVERKALTPRRGVEEPVGIEEPPREPEPEPVPAPQPEEALPTPSGPTAKEIRAAIAAKQEGKRG